ncbi:hypothetical protein KKB64_05480 [Patescibacteria group bacterium]|nr:hypothetical protein [Patescibacteria group bacterium]MBU1473202.1 hypothetical protein [Patescibacteria group bacterium]MBU2459748.1 hypothetical protein [Patescibacteria group bacterium]MBU2544743.1 hypothetical protein [Patescibacteria group bacterium]
MKRILNIILGILPLCALILIGVEVFISNELAGTGGELANIESRISQEAGEREVLYTEVASASSLLVIRQKAETLGFADPGKNQIISLAPDQLPVAALYHLQ